MITTDT